MQFVVIDVKEKKKVAARWAAYRGYTMPVLLDTTGAVADRYAPADIPQDIRGGWNLIIDRHGVIRFFTVVNPPDFDARLLALQRRLDEVLSTE